MQTAVAALQSWMTGANCTLRTDIQLALAAFPSIIVQAHVCGCVTSRATIDHLVLFQLYCSHCDEIAAALFLPFHSGKKKHSSKSVSSPSCLCLPVNSGQ